MRQLTLYSSTEINVGIWLAPGNKCLNLKKINGMVMDGQLFTKQVLKCNKIVVKNTMDWIIGKNTW